MDWIRKGDFCVTWPFPHGSCFPAKITPGRIGCCLWRIVASITLTLPLNTCALWTLRTLACKWFPHAMCGGGLYFLLMWYACYYLNSPCVAFTSFTVVSALLFMRLFFRLQTFFFPTTAKREKGRSSREIILPLSDLVKSLSWLVVRVTLYKME